MKTLNEKYIEIDRALFEKMKSESQSDNERRFFKEMEHRQDGHPTSMDWLLSHKDNPDGVGFFRSDYFWYMLEAYDKIGNLIQSEYIGLHSFLFDDLSKFNLRISHSCMFDYLRSIDYKGIDYHRDQDWD